MNKPQLTQQGFLKLKKELEELAKTRKPKAIERLHQARAMGDLSENSEYTSARDDLAFIEGRIQEIEEMLKNVEVVKQTNFSGKISLGSTVTVETDNQKEVLQIVGEFEADPLKKKLSSISPIGKALLDKKVGETVEVNVPDGRKKYKILSIN